MDFIQKMINRELRSDTGRGLERNHEQLIEVRAADARQGRLSVNEITRVSEAVFPAPKACTSLVARDRPSGIRQDASQVGWRRIEK